MEAAIRISVGRRLAAEVEVRIDRISKWPAAIARSKAGDRLSLLERNCKIIGSRRRRDGSDISHNLNVAHNRHSGQFG
jgi:hypothetical protein